MSCSVMACLFNRQFSVPTSVFSFKTRKMYLYDLVTTLLVSISVVVLRYHWLLHIRVTLTTTTTTGGLTAHAGDCSMINSGHYLGH